MELPEDPSEPQERSPIVHSCKKLGQRGAIRRQKLNGFLSFILDVYIEKGICLSRKIESAIQPN